MPAGMLVRYLEMIRILLQCALDGGIQSQLSSHRILLLVRFITGTYTGGNFVPAPTITTLIPVGLAVEPFDG